MNSFVAIFFINPRVRLKKTGVRQSERIIKTTE